MKCSVCGADVRNGRCTFCGFQPTAQDIASEKAWAEEKKALSGHGSAPARKIRMPSVPKAGKPVRKASVPKAQPLPEGRTYAKPSPKVPAKRQKKAGKGRRETPAGRMPLAIRIIIILWVLFCVWTLCTVLKNEYGIDIPEMIFRFFQWIGRKLSNEPEYIVPDGNYILYG